jgi:O-antigen ligase
MRILERLLLGIVILEIPLQVDAYLFYQEHEASFGAVGGINLSATTFCLIGLYCLWLFDVATLRQRKSLHLTVSVPLLVYVGAVAFSMFVAANQMLAISYFTLLVQALMLFLYVASRLQNRNDIVFVSVLLACSLGLQAAIIIGSWVVGPQLAGRELSLGPLSVSVWEDGRSCGTLSTPVSAGSYLALLLLPVGSLLLTPVPARVKWLALLAATSGLLAIALTQSRGSLAGVVIAAFVFGVMLFLRGWISKWSVAAVVLMAAIVTIPLIQLFEKRIVAGDEGSAASRHHLAQVAWNLIQDHPIVGVGAGNYHVAAQPYENAPSFRSEWSYTVHCTYLLEWSEAGLLGLCAFVAFLLSIIFHGWKVWQLRDPLLAPLALAIAAMVVGQMVHMLVDMFNSRPYIETLWCCAALMMAMVRISEVSGVNKTSWDSEVKLAPQLVGTSAGRFKKSYSASPPVQGAPSRAIAHSITSND